MKQTYSLAVLLLLASSVEAHKLITKSHTKTKDWDDLLTNQGVFSERTYSSDMPDGYGDVVDEVMQEHDQALESRRQRAVEAQRAQAADIQRKKNEEAAKVRA